MSVLSNLFRRGGTSGNSFNPTGLRFGNITQVMGQPMQQHLGGVEQRNQQAVTNAQRMQSEGEAAAQGAKDQQEKDASAKLLRENTARSMMALRQNLAGQQNRSLALLRRNLAQRGALDSGSLGAGITNIGNETSGLMAQGTQAAARGENDALLDLLKISQARAFQRERDTQAQRDKVSLLDLMRRYSQEDRDRESMEAFQNKPSEMLGQLLGLAGQYGMSRIPGYGSGAGG